MESSKPVYIYGDDHHHTSLKVLELREKGKEVFLRDQQEQQKEKNSATSSRKVAPPPEPKRRLERKTTEDINKSADAFINKFRQQLLIQRLESIENYEQMLARGT